VETKIIHKFPIIINFVMWQLEIMELKKKKSPSVWCESCLEGRHCDVVAFFHDSLSDGCDTGPWSLAHCVRAMMWGFGSWLSDGCDVGPWSMAH
jgi:hypothetical protein